MNRDNTADLRHINANPAVHALMELDGDDIACLTCEGKGELPVGTHSILLPCPDCGGGDGA